MNVFPVIPVIVLGVVALAVVLVRWRRWADESSQPWFRRRRWRWLAMSLVLVLIGIQPAVGSAASPAQASNVDVLIVLDRTFSMQATDWDGAKPRFDGVRSDIAELIKQNPGARYSLITFDNAARVEAPWTTDTTAILGAVQAMRPLSPFNSSGSSLDVSVELVTTTLKTLQSKDPDRRRVVVFLSDGEQTAEKAVGSFAGWKPLLNQGLVLGYGTPQGATMVDPDTGKVYELYPGAPDKAISKYDEKTLTTIADQSGATFEHRTAPGSLPRFESSGSGAALGSVIVGFSLAPLLAIMLFALAVWELWPVADQRRELARVGTGRAGR